MQEWAPTFALLAALAAFFTVIGFWTRWSDRISKAESKADAAETRAQDALQEAAEAKNEIAALNEALDALSSGLNMFRIEVAKEYVDKDMIREVEMRVIAAVKDAAKASTDAIAAHARSSNEAIAALGRRIDGLSDHRHS